ncbi:hypothetical protein OY671_010488, partial [Metschnikowia pulcherrima]
MFGISPLGWIHTLGSSPAIPVAVYMFARHGRIVPRSIPGSIYFISMSIGAVTGFLVAHEPAGSVICVVTLVSSSAGYGVGHLHGSGRAATYIETVCSSSTAFLSMSPTVTEVSRRVPDGHPLVTDSKSPSLLGAQGSLLVISIVGLTAQIVWSRRRG